MNNIMVKKAASFSADLEAIGERARAARENGGLSQGDWSNLLGKSSNVVAHWESGRVPIPLKDLIAYDEKLGVDLHWLMTGKSFAESEVVQVVARVLAL
jgi:transcriptional regulator with XRE-family HTH domain